MRVTENEARTKVCPQLGTCQTSDCMKWRFHTVEISEDQKEQIMDVQSYLHGCDVKILRIKEARHLLRIGLRQSKKLVEDLMENREVAAIELDIGYCGDTRRV